MKRLILKQCDWLKEHLDDIIMRKRHTQDSEEFEEMIVPSMWPVVPLAVFLAVRSVGLVCPRIRCTASSTSHVGKSPTVRRIRWPTSAPKTCSSTYSSAISSPGSSLSSSIGPPIRIPLRGRDSHSGSSGHAGSPFAPSNQPCSAAIDPRLSSGTSAPPPCSGARCSVCEDERSFSS